MKRLPISANAVLYLYYWNYCLIIVSHFRRLVSQFLTPIKCIRETRSTGDFNLPHYQKAFQHYIYNVADNFTSLSFCHEAPIESPVPPA